MRPHGTAQELEARRHRAVGLLRDGRPRAQIAEIIGVTPTSVSRWWKAYREGGAAALRAKPPPGRRCKLSEAQKHQLRQRLLEGARASGFGTDLWTCSWYPIPDDQAPNLYDPNGCLDKYDRAYGKGSLSVEKRNMAFMEGHYLATSTLLESDAECTTGFDIDNADGDNNHWTGWEPNVPADFWDEGTNYFGHDGDMNSQVDASSFGHCDMRTAAVICENEPSGEYNAPNGIVFHPEDKKSLLVALYHNFGKVKHGPDIRAYVWHADLEQWVIGEDRMFGCDTFNVVQGDDTLWNSPIFRIKEAKYYEKPGQSSEKVVKIDCQVDKWTDGATTLSYSYWLTYRDDGVASTPDDWITEVTGRPDSTFMPARQTDVGIFWEGELDYQTIKAIIPLQ